MNITEKNTYRISNGTLVEVFDLGLLPISCFPLPKDPETHPLKLMLKKESGLVQLTHSVNPDDMYSLVYGKN